MVNQAAHGFVVGDVVRLSGASTYAKAQADSAANAEVVGMVAQVLGTNSFLLCTNGRITGLTGLTANTVYFLSPSSAGALTATEPTTAGQVSKPLFITDTTTSGWLFNYRGEVLAAAGASAGDLRKTTAKVVNTTVTETDLLNGEFTIPANSLDADGVMTFRASGDFLQQSGGAADPPRWRLKLGGTTIIDTGRCFSNSFISNAARHGWFLEVFMYMHGATNSQWWSFNLLIPTSGSVLSAAGFAAWVTGKGNWWIPSAGGGPPTVHLRGTSDGLTSISMTSSRLLELTIENESASATYETTLQSAIVSWQ